MSWVRWLFYIVALWSICAVWADDQLGFAAGTPNNKVYWALVALVGAVALVIELRETRRTAPAE